MLPNGFSVNMFISCIIPGLHPYYEREIEYNYASGNICLRLHTSYRNNKRTTMTADNTLGKISQQEMNKIREGCPILDRYLPKGENGDGACSAQCMWKERLNGSDDSCPQGHESEEYPNYIAKSTIEPWQEKPVDFGSCVTNPPSGIDPVEVDSFPGIDA